MAAVSPLAPARFPALPPIAGVRLAAFAGGIRYAGRDDLMLAELAPGTAVAGVFTRSLTAGAPVLWCRDCLPGGQARAIVVNSGNANVFTGRAGKEAVATTAAAAAKLLGCDPRQVFIASTGVIGETLPTEKILGALPEAGGPALGRGLGEGGAGDHDHRHLSQGLDRRRRDRRRRGAPQRLRQGLRHDRPGHGDDAGLCLHRRGIAGGGAPAAARRRRGPLVQRDHGRRRHLDQRHPPPLRDRAGARTARWRARATAGSTISAGRSTPC